MKFSVFDILLSVLSIVFILGSSVFVAWWSASGLHLLMGTSMYLPVLQVLVFAASFFLISILLLWGIRAFFPLENGIYDLNTNSSAAIIWKLHGFLYIFNLGLFINSYIVPVNIRGTIFSLLGSHIGKNVMIGGKILEPALVEIGDYSILGEDTLVTAHAKSGHRVELGKIVIGREVTIGVKAVILPGAHVGDHAVVAAGAVVTKNSFIPSNEIWGGVPAQKIGTVRPE